VGRQYLIYPVGQAPMCTHMFGGLDGWVVSLGIILRRRSPDI
jgi:hypothetical protein